jgi:hypothetical protein
LNGYVEAGWSVTAVALGLYTWRLMHRSRALARALPSDPEPVPMAAVRPVAAASAAASPVGDVRVPETQPAPTETAVVAAQGDPGTDGGEDREAEADTWQ